MSINVNFSNQTHFYKKERVKDNNYLRLSTHLILNDWIKVERDVGFKENILLGYEFWQKDHIKINISYPYLSNKEFQWAIGIIESTKRVNE